jgi:hypothetical protein
MVLFGHQHGLYKKSMKTTTENIEEKVGQVAQVIVDNRNVGNTERIISGVAAVLLSIYAMKNKDSTMGKGMAAVSGFLLTRATTGFCPLNKAIGRNSLLNGSA